MSDIGHNTVRSWANELSELEEQIEALQKSKRDFYAAIRDEHGKPVANGLKAAMRIHRMDSQKRTAAEQIDAEAFRILSIIEGASHAPRATRVENIEEISPAPHLPVADGGQPSTPSSDDGGAKMEAACEAAPERAAPADIASVELEQAAEDFAPFLRKEEPNERCMQPASCKFARHPNKLTCSDCTTAWQISQRKARAA